jgi:hypothetical protein
MSARERTYVSRKTATAVGALFLIAMVTSLGGGIWLESFLTGPDVLSTVSGNQAQVVTGVLLELINCVAVVGIAALMVPILKTQSEALGIGYVGFRIVETTLLVVAALIPLSMIALSREYLAAGSADATSFLTLGAVLMAARGHLLGLLVALFFSLGALLLYYGLYQTRLVPRFISIWGFIAVALLLTWNVLEAFGISISFGIVLGLLIILNEIFLGIWLIARGFNPSAVTSG